MTCAFQIGRPRINTALTSVPEVCTRFASAIEEALKDCPDNSTEERWSHIRDAIYNSAMTSFGKRVKKNQSRNNQTWASHHSQMYSSAKLQAQAFREGISCTPEGQKRHPADCQEMR